MNSSRTPQTSLSTELKDIIIERNILTTRTRMKVLKALDEIHQQNTNEKRQSLRCQVIQEILTSEVTYLHQLEIIMEFFMKPILEKQLLNPMEYATLFENIETLYNVNGELFKELKENADNIAHAFHKLAPFLKLYSVYAYNYQRALLLLQEIQQCRPLIAELILKQETRPEVSTKLTSLLITPIQRVPRYKLLLKEVLRYTSAKHSDYKTLHATLVEIEKVAEHINTLVAEYEDTQKVLELQKRIVNPINLIKPGRKLIRQGPLMRVSRRGNSSYRRHFILLSDNLLYCKGNPDSSLTICCSLPLNKCKIERILSNGLFRVECMQESLLLYSENGDSEAWISSLQDAIKKYIECRQTLRKDSSSRIPLRHVNRFSSLDNRLEKRLKRRRNIEESSQNLQDSSKVIYINQDVESDAGEDGNMECCSPFKKIKLRQRNNVWEIKSWIGDVKKFRKTPCKLHIPANVVSKNTEPYNLETKYEDQIDVENIHITKNEKLSTTQEVQNASKSTICEYSELQNAIFSNIGNYCSYIAKSFRGLFGWRSLNK